MRSEARCPHRVSESLLRGIWKSRHAEKTQRPPQEARTDANCGRTQYRRRTRDWRWIVCSSQKIDVVCEYSAQQYCGAAVRRHVAGKGPGILLRRHLGGAAESAGEDSAAQGNGACVIVLVQR